MVTSSDCSFSGDFGRMVDWDRLTGVAGRGTDVGDTGGGMHVGLFENMLTKEDDPGTGNAADSAVEVDATGCVGKDEETGKSYSDD